MTAVGKNTKATAKDVARDFAAHLRITSGESLSKDFVKVALTLWRSTLSDVRIKENLLLQDEFFGKSGSVANSIYKLEAVSQCCNGDLDKILWTLTAVADSLLNRELKQSDLSVDKLTGKKTGNKGPEA